MKARCKLPRLSGALALSIALSMGAALAGPTDAKWQAKSDAATAQKKIAAKKKPVYYVMSSASPIPIPIEWVQGIPTTATPMQIIGHLAK
jgi:hypothetical protein